MKNLFRRIFPFQIEFEPWGKKDKALGTFLVGVLVFSSVGIYQQSGGKWPVGLGINVFSLIESFNILFPSLPFFQQEELAKTIDATPTITPAPTFAPLNGIKPASPSAILATETPFLFRKDVAVKDGWMLPENHFWYLGYIYQKPTAWQSRGESCGSTFGPTDGDNNQVWISMCGPYYNGYSLKEYEKNLSEKVLEKNTTALNNYPATFFLLQNENGFMSKTYFVDVWNIMSMAGDISKFDKSGMFISLTAKNKELLDSYTPIYTQFLETLTFAEEAKLKEQSEQLCKDGKPIIENQISQFEYQQYKKSVTGVFDIIDRRTKMMVDDESAADTMRSHLYKDMNLTFTIVSYLPGEIKVYTPGMCVVKVKEERVITEKGKPVNKIFVRSFIFSNLTDKWLLEGYYPENIQFRERYNGFYNNK